MVDVFAVTLIARFVVQFFDVFLQSFVKSFALLTGMIRLIELRTLALVV